MALFDKIINSTGFFDFIPGIGDDDENNNDNTVRNLALKAAKFITLGPTGFLVSSAVQNLATNIDIGQIGSNFINTVNNLISQNSTDLNLGNLTNSVKSNITDFIDSNNITNRFSNTNLTNLINSNLIKDANLVGTFSDLINSAAQGSLVGRFVDADDADNLIELTLQDGQWPGGLRSFNGNDRVLGTEGRDIANGNQGNDTLIGGNGDDFLRGGQNEDLLDGGAGNDVLNGNRGDDTCRGGLGDDLVRGGQGNDILYGDPGNDVIIGDLGSNFLYGGEGADDFILQGNLAVQNAATADRILDFNVAQGDRIKLTNITNINQISLGSVDVNQDGIGDTAILGSNNQVLGVVINANASTFNIQGSILLVGAQDTTINTVG